MKMPSFLSSKREKPFKAFISDYLRLG